MAGREVSLHLLGTRGEMRVDLWEGVCRWQRRGEGWQERIVPPSQPICGFAGMRESIGAFLEAVAGQRPVEANTDVVRRVHQAALACAESEAERRDVRVEAL